MDDWNRAIEQERRALQRIVALLLALAALAERVSGRSPVVRRLVLWLLYPAEAAARNFALDACEVSLPTPRTAFSDDGPAEALRLAQCFRALAFILEAIVVEIVTSCIAAPGFAQTGIRPLGLNINACFAVQSSALIRIDTS